MRTRLLALGVLLLCAASSPAAVFTVTNSADSGPGSLRQAILDSNAAVGADSIQFNIPGSGLQTIALASALPLLTDSQGTLLDGYTQPGALPNSQSIGTNALLRIEVAPAAAFSSCNGLVLISDRNVVRGLVINGFGCAGILIGGSGNIVEGNFVGTDATGMLAKGNQTGVGIEFASPPSVQPTDNRIGGAEPAARNLISGNSGTGAGIFGGTANRIEGNLIGTDAAWTAAISNSVGVALNNSAAANIIGGSTRDFGNVISGNVTCGVVAVFGATRNIIQGNRIGADATGSQPLANACGVLLISQAFENVVDRNLIGGNAGDAVRIVGTLSDRNTISGNNIGFDVNGVAPLPNAGHGVIVRAGASRNTIGPAGGSSGNVIAFSGGNGVQIGSGNADPATGNVILGNGIGENSLAGIDLGGDGETANDAGDTDAGPNELQNAPVLTFAVRSAVTGRVVVGGEQDSDPGGGPNRIQVFQVASPLLPSRNEGWILLADLTGQPAGRFSFVTPPFSVPITTMPGDLVTATATTSHGTSEFAQSIPLSQNLIPVANAGPDQTVAGGLISLDGSSSSDPDVLPRGATIRDGSFTWTQVSGPSTTLSNATTSRPAFTPTSPGVYVFALVVSDGLDRSTNLESVSITVVLALPAVDVPALGLVGSAVLAILLLGLGSMMLRR